MSEEPRSSDRRSGWIMLLCGLPLTLGGVLMTWKSPFLSRDFVLGLLCLLMFGACTAIGAHGLLRRPESVPAVDTSRTYRLRFGGLKLLGWAFVCLVFAAMGVFILTEVAWLSFNGIIGGFLNLAFFGLGGLFMLYKAATGSRAAYDIGPSGITVWRMNGLHVPWAEVASVWETEHYGQWLVCFDIPEWDRLKGAVSPATRAAVALNAKLGFPPLTIGAVGLSVSPETLRAIIFAHATAAGVSVAGYSD